MPFKLDILSMIMGLLGAAGAAGAGVGAGGEAISGLSGAAMKAPTVGGGGVMSTLASPALSDIATAGFLSSISPIASGINMLQNKPTTLDNLVNTSKMISPKYESIGSQSRSLSPKDMTSDDVWLNMLLKMFSEKYYKDNPLLK